MALAVGWTEAECLAGGASADRDLDGVLDRCEHDLAAAFAPVLRVDERECGWDESVAPGRIGGEYLYAVQRRPSGDGLRIAYMPAYYRDCGWSLPVCRLTPSVCEGHAGDSEMVALDVAFDPRTARWETRRVFLSAHCHGRSAGRCRWYEGRGLERFSWADGVRRGAPLVWVAHGKHGGYPTAAECDTGHWGYDGCRGNRTAYRFPVASPRQNAGSRTHPFPHGSGEECIGPREAGWRSDVPDPAARECFWDPAARFRGWQGAEAGAGATGYGRYLREVAGF
ncbi:MAG TPA: hypothetical protein VGR37_02465 [Longimicrobiaceae bacterium]|nr:hypothetical protein [Longimicrobiaceae bacterium]